MTQTQKTAPSLDSLTALEAKHIIRSHQESAPIKISEVATALGLLVKNAPLAEGISGKIFNDPSEGSKSGYVIHVAANEGIKRQRFTAAHEIAHFVLHRDQIGKGIADDTLYRSGLSSHVEREANELAADILMPWHLINGAMESGKTSVQQLADYFNVSITAMSVRLGLPT